VPLPLVGGGQHLQGSECAILEDGVGARVSVTPLLYGWEEALPLAKPSRRLGRTVPSSSDSGGHSQLPDSLPPVHGK